MGSFGFSDSMGPQLRAFAEKQLVDDLNRYKKDGHKFQQSDVVFDWSDSCLEGHRTRWLDGEIENFSGVRIFDTANRLIAEGWMEFILTEDTLEVFWWFLRGAENRGIQDKVTNNVPIHIWGRIGPEIQSQWKRYAPN